MKIRTFIRLNFWAFLLDVISIIIVISFLLNHNTVFKGILFFIFVIVIYNGIRLHFLYTYRKKSLEILILKNREKIREDSFNEFMKSPCGRMIVVEALLALEKKDLYPILLKKNHFFKNLNNKNVSKVEIVPYKES